MPSRRCIVVGDDHTQLGLRCSVSGVTHPRGVAEERTLQRVQHDVAGIVAETELPVGVYAATLEDETGTGLRELTSPPGGGTCVRATIPT